MSARRESRFAERTRNHRSAMKGGQLTTFSHTGDEEGWGAPALSPAVPGKPGPRTESHACQSPRLPSVANGGWCARATVAPPDEESACGLTASHPTGYPAYSQTLPREPRSAAIARRLVRTALIVWDLEPLIEDAALIITELVSNAVDHGRLPSIRVIVSRPSANTIRLGVVDRSKAVPTLRMDVEEGQIRGRGLLLVDAFTDRWGTELYRWGKQVWAELGEEA
ncbi:ATP-binding protein [Streptomyces sp. NPDC012450]|uniref:ATP-binding protein n=1 Tax=Streptomyces sp. NPDC012450 TaxID=3364834 RepID=UPI0036E4174B